MTLLCCEKSTPTDNGQGREQTGCVAKVVGRCRVAHARRARHPAKRKAFESVCVELLLGSFEQRRAQIAVVIGTSLSHVERGLGYSNMPTDLDTVKLAANLSALIFTV